MTTVTVIPEWIPKEKYRTFVLSDSKGQCKIALLGFIKGKLYIISDCPSPEGKIVQHKDTNRIIADEEGKEYFVRTFAEVITPSVAGKEVQIITSDKLPKEGDIVTITPQSVQCTLQQMRVYVSNILYEPLLSGAPPSLVLYVYNSNGSVYAFIWDTDIKGWQHSGPQSKQYYTVTF